MISLVGSVAFATLLLAAGTHAMWPSAISKFDSSASSDPNALLANAMVCPTASTTPPYFCSEYCGFYSMSFTNINSNDLLNQIVEECPRDDCVNLFPADEKKPTNPFCLYNFTANTHTAHASGAKAVCCCPSNNGACADQDEFEFIVAGELAHPTTEEPTTSSSSTSTTESTTSEEPTSSSSTTEESTTGSSTTEQTTENPEWPTDLPFSQVSNITCTHVMTVSRPSPSGQQHLPNGDKSLLVSYNADCKVDTESLKALVKGIFA